MKKQLESILLFGSLWGLEEATLGHFLHYLPISIGWIFWFPLACLFLYAAYHITGKLSSVFYTACLASAIKLTDLFFSTRIDYVLNPAVSILLEGCAVGLVLWAMSKLPSLNRYPIVPALSASILSQCFYLIYIAVVPNFVTVIPAVLNPATVWKDGWHGLVNGLTVFVFWKLFQAVRDSDKKQNTNLWIKQKNQPAIKAALTAVPYLLLVITILIQWMM